MRAPARIAGGTGARRTLPAASAGPKRARSARSTSGGAPSRPVPRASGVDPRPSGVDPRPSGVDPRPSGVDPQPSGVDPRPSGVDPQPSGVGPRPSGVGPRPSGVDPRPSGVDPQPSGVDPQPSGVDPRPSGVDPRPSGVDPRPSGVDPQPSGLGIRRPEPGPRPAIRWPGLSGRKPRQSAPGGESLADAQRHPMHGAAADGRGDGGRCVLHGAFLPDARLPYIHRIMYRRADGFLA